MVVSAATTIAERDWFASRTRTTRSMVTALAISVSVKTHSAITVDVARNTKPGVSTVSNAMVAALPRASSRSPARYRYVNAPAPIIAAIEIDFSQNRLPGNCATANTGASSSGKPGGNAGMIGVAAELISA